MVSDRCLCVCLSCSCAEMAELIDFALVLWTGVGRRKNKFNHICQVAPICPHWMTYCSHLVNTIEPSICGGDAVFCRITLTMTMRVLLTMVSRRLLLSVPSFRRPVVFSMTVYH